MQQAAPEVYLEIAQANADRIGVKQGDELEIASRRGTVRAAARIADILPGHVFLPFHYGYWDEKDGHHRAANELTISGWDPFSKQPYYKYAAVQVRKAALLSNLGSKAVNVASQVKDRASEMMDQLLSGTHSTPRSHVPDMIGMFRSGLKQFAEACRWLKKLHFEEMELVGVCEPLARWCDELHDKFSAFAEKYGEQPAKEPETLRQALFPAARPGEFGELRDLQSLDMLASAVHGANTALFQAAQRLRDRAMLDLTMTAEERIRRIQAWILNQVKHRSVHSLLTPM